MANSINYLINGIDVTQHFPLVTLLCKHYFKLGNGVEVEEITNWGRFGLVVAAQKYDPKFKTKFSSYASWWIKKYVRDYIKKCYKHRQNTSSLQDDENHLEISDAYANWLMKKNNSSIDILEIIGRAKLSPKQQTVIKMRFGIGEKPKTLSKVGKAIGCSAEYARIIQESALKKLRGMVAADKLEE